MFVGIVLFIVTIFELIIIYFLHKDIISPDFIFALGFVIAEMNLITNIGSFGVEISVNTVLVITVGIIFFSLGVWCVKRIEIKATRIKIKNIISAREIYISNKLLCIMITFNLFTIGYVSRAVAAQTYRMGYHGSILKAMGMYRTYMTWYGEDMRLGLIATIATALSESIGYVLGGIIARKLVYKQKLSFLLIFAFITAFASTFCQGSRGGFYMIITAVVIYVLEAKQNRKFQLNIKIIIYFIIGIFLMLEIFNIFADIIGKSWNVSVYEYISVYLGDPIINLNTVLKEGIAEAPLWGYSSFKAIYKFVYRKLGWDFPNFSIGGFKYIDGHSLGNVYTIFAYMISDFGILGSNIMLFVLGLCSQLLYNVAKKSRTALGVSKILYGYILTSIGFSFFANKVCENISIYHVCVFVMEMYVAYLCTKPQNNS